MATVLSQNEIDDLLNALTSGEKVESSNEDKKQDSGVRLYDFKTANKFPKEHMRTLNILFDNFAYLLSTRLTGMLRTICEATVISVEEQLFGEFNNSIPTPVVLGVVDMQPLHGSILIELTAPLAYGIVSRLFGGIAEYTEVNKSFTEIEILMLENVMHKVLGYLSEAWEKVCEVRSNLARIETSAQFTQITATNEPAAIITLNVKIDKVEDMMTICIPHVALQPIAKLLTSSRWMLGSLPRSNDGQANEQIRKQLENTEATLRVVFNEAQTTIRELLTIKVGDVLCLDHHIKQLITVNLEHIPKFKGVLGLSGQKQAIQIAEIIKENFTGEQ